MSCVIALAPPPSSHYLCPTSPRSLNREALEEVLQQESAARPVCGSRSEAKPSSPPSHPSLFDILPIFFNLTKVHKMASNAVQSFPPLCTVVTNRASRMQSQIYLNFAEAIQIGGRAPVTTAITDNPILLWYKRLPVCRRGLISCQQFRDLRVL